MKVVGLTGGIGSGKSTVAKMFQALGVPVYVADTEAKKLMNSSTELKSGIIELFGDQAYIDGELNRGYIASIVFSNKTKLDHLNQLVHPAVHVHFSEWIKQQQSPYIIQENALIFEKNAQGEFDKVITVSADKKNRIQRVMARDGITEMQVLERMNNQLDEEVKISGADYVILNNSLEDTQKLVQGIHQELLEQIP